MRTSTVLCAAAALAIVLGCASTKTPPAAAPASMPPEVAQQMASPGLRLPGGARPSRESVALRIDPHATTYSGTVRIQLEIQAPLSAIWLHAQGLRILRGSLTQGASPRKIHLVGAGTEGAGGSPGTTVDRLGVWTETALVPGSAELVLDFEGTLDRERSRGVYRVDEPDGPYVYTFFEPVDARRAFPCFDEPSFKIPWELTLTVPPGMRRLRQRARGRARRPQRDGWREVRFDGHPSAAQLPGRVRRGAVRDRRRRLGRPPPDAGPLPHPPRPRRPSWPTRSRRCPGW